MNFDLSQITFAQLDKANGIPELPPATDEEYPLPAWYRAVRETPLSELSLEDLCRACRQKIYPEYIVPLAVRHLKADPCAGEMYGGELLVALKSVPSNYWEEHPEDRTTVRRIIEQSLSDLDEDVRQDALELLSLIQL